MASYRLASTQLDGLRPLGTPGQRSHGLVSQVVARELGDRHARLFAEPVPDPNSGQIDWFVDAEAAPRCLADLGEAEAAEARRQLGELVGDISELGERLSRARDAETQRLGKALLNAIEVPGEESIYLVGDQPVLVCWGYQYDRPNVARGILSGLIPSRSQSAVGEEESRAAALQERPVEVAALVVPSASHWLWWLLWLLAITLAAASLYLFLTACGLRGLSFANFCPKPSAIASQMDAEAARQQILEDEIAARRRDIAQAGASCRPVVEEQSRAEPQPPEPVAPEPQAPEPEQPEPEKAEDPQEPTQTAELEACPAKRPVEVVLVLDASTSMDWDFDQDQRAEAELDRLNQRIARAGNIFEQMMLVAERDALFRRLLNSPGIDRIDVAKNALVEIVDRSPGDVTFSFLSFNRCGPPRNQGTYSPPERGALQSRIRGIQTEQNTALADALRSAPRYVVGGRTEENPVSIVLLSDGEDSCQGDPCGAARWLAGELPHTHVNFVAIGRGLEKMRCIPDATNGLFLEPQNVDELFSMMSTASGQDLPEHCK